MHRERAGPPIFPRRLAFSRSGRGSFWPVDPAGVVCDHRRMDCQRSRDIISARLDGEATAFEAEAVYDHLAVCSACRRWEDEALRCSRSVRIGTAGPVPDLSARILAAVTATGSPDLPARRRRLDPNATRAALGVLGFLQLLAGLPALLFGVDGGAPIHVAREIGSFDLALAVGFVFAAWRPAYAPGLLPVAAGLVVALAGSTAADILRNQVSAVAEAGHSPQVLGLMLVAVLARSAVESPRPVLRV